MAAYLKKENENETHFLHGNHLKLNARMGSSPGDMPLYYDLGVLKEHEWVREHAGLFDVSHMGQISLKGKVHKIFSKVDTLVI